MTHAATVRGNLGEFAIRTHKLVAKVGATAQPVSSSSEERSIRAVAPATSGRVAAKFEQPDKGTAAAFPRHTRQYRCRDQPGLVLVPDHDNGTRGVLEHIPGGTSKH